MRKAVYSPCKSCREDPTRAPLWQLKAVKIVHDKKNQSIEYSDAWLEIAGIPVFYTPYFSHPDPTVKRRSGFLTPSIGNSSDLGVVMEAPYYYVLTPSSDVTLNPIITTNEGPILAVDYREILDSGTINWNGSFTRDSLDDIRGHFIGKARFNIDDTWRWGLDAERASDDTYMRRYGFSSLNTLTSRAFAEGFRGRNYMSMDAYSFQSLSGVDNITPLILPALEFSHIGQPDRFGGRTNLDVNFLALNRAPGTDTRRLTVDAGWQVPYIGPMGDVYRFSTSLRGDLYHIDDFKRAGGKGSFSGFTGRIIPRASLEWRYPFVKTDGPFSQIIEPLGSIVVSPYGGNPDTIPNEDSLAPELDDTNLFKENRFAGFDRIDGGPRINYGLKWGIFGSGIGRTSAMIGQSYRFKNDDTFAEGSGIEDNFSDFIGVVRVQPASLVDLVYRIRLDKDNLEIRRNELNFTAGVPAFTVNTNYILFDRQAGSEFPGREEINLSLSSRINRFWRTSARATRDLSTNDMRSIGFNLTYEDECLVFSTGITRTFFEDRDLKPTDAIVFSLSFKTLGDVSTGFSTSQ